MDQPIRQHDDQPLERCWGLGDEAAHEPDAEVMERLAIDSSSTKWVRKALEWANVRRDSHDRAAVRGGAGRTTHHKQGVSPAGRSRAQERDDSALRRDGVHN